MPPDPDPLNKWREFEHEVFISVRALIYALNGICLQHEHLRFQMDEMTKRAAAEGVALDPDVHRNMEPVFAFPRLRGWPSIGGAPFIEHAAPDGPMMQLVLVGWITNVYNKLWESKYRNSIEDAFMRNFPEQAGFIRPRHDVLGDLRHIRNDLLHSGLASENEVGKCTILKWFPVGAPMVMQFWHVLDFLNQMGWLGTANLLLGEDGQPPKVNSWHMDRQGEPENPAPRLVSIRPLFALDYPDPRYRHGVSMCFEDGTFGNCAVGAEQEETEAQVKERNRNLENMTIDGRGNLHVPGFGTVDSSQIYRDILTKEPVQGPMAGRPWTQFRE